MPKKHRTIEALPCTKCGTEMYGVHHYCIRDTCEGCGGKSLLADARSHQKKRVLRERSA